MWGNAESAICIMAASIPILRALFRDGARAVIPRGYQTHEASGTTAMTESGQDTSRTAFDRSGIFARPRPLPQTIVHGLRPADQNGSTSATSIPHETSATGLSSESGARSFGDHDIESDEESIEMTNYQTRRPQTPTDFLGTKRV